MDKERREKKEGGRRKGSRTKQTLHTSHVNHRYWDPFLLRSRRPRLFIVWIPGIALTAVRRASKVSCLTLVFWWFFLFSSLFGVEGSGVLRLSEHSKGAMLGISSFSLGVRILDSSSSFLGFSLGYKLPHGGILICGCCFHFLFSQLFSAAAPSWRPVFTLGICIVYMSSVGI